MGRLSLCMPRPSAATSAWKHTSPILECSDARQGVFFLKLLRNTRTGLLRPARRRNDIVHPQILDHLAVMIEGVAYRDDRKPEPGHLVGSKGSLYLSQHIALINAVSCFVKISK